MTPFRHGGNVPIEDRIDRLARLVLVVLLLATLGWVGQGRPTQTTQNAAARNGAPLVLAAKPVPREESAKRLERRAKAI
jgi:hypothetical protein